jgi:hypothetical protein
VLCKHSPVDGPLWNRVIVRGSVAALVLAAPLIMSPGRRL